MPSLPAFPSRAAILAACLLVPGCGHDTPHPLPDGAHLIADPALSEMSGLQASRAQPGVLWSVNDSGSLPRLYRVGIDGSALGRVRLEGAWLRDAETLALWPREDGDWILIGDVGDNRGRRDQVRIHALPEPAKHADRARIAWSLAFAYPDGPRDAEGIAVDPQDDALLVISKREAAPRLYRVPLPGDATGVPGAALTAEPVATLAEGVFDGEVTGLDISPDGRRMAVLSYRGLYLWERAPGQAWSEVLATAPRTLPMPRLRKAEAMSFDAEGLRILVGSERHPAPLVSIPVGAAGG